MIEVRDLTKIYDSRKAGECRALDGINFVLPDTGMVFVVGKSGSGKSTLLNLLGGLDKQTSGDVIVDGAAFSGFTERNFDCYRNSYVGFVFQDYCLMEKLTVFENISMSLELKNAADDDLVRQIMRDVDVAELGDRHPKQLSGGQRQRVAIARALVKRPKLVLADEPTGNLDGRSTEQVLDMLKAYSVNHLVLVVSHNRQNADQYADRIIELSAGRIQSDTVRNPHAKQVDITDSEIVLQQGVSPTEEQLQAINRQLMQGKPTHLRKVDDMFVPTPPVAATAPADTPHFDDLHLSRRGRRRMFAMFTRKQALSLVVTLLLVVALVSLLGVGQMFLQFSALDATVRLLQDEGEKQVFSLQKGYIDKNGDLATGKLVRIADEDLQAFSEGYDGKIYPVYNVCVTGSNTSMESYNFVDDSSNFRSVFSQTANGVMVCDMDYLTKVFGDEDGQLTVKSGAIPTEVDEDDISVIITDYLADSILQRSPDLFGEDNNPYSELTAGNLLKGRYKVCAVIDTGYQGRYKSLIDLVDADASFEDMVSDPTFEQFLAEANATLNIAYSINPNFYELYSTYEKTDFKKTSYFAKSSLSMKGVKLKNVGLNATLNTSLKDDEIRLSKAQWRLMTGQLKGDKNTAYWNSFVGQKITLKVFAAGTEEEIYSHEFTIQGFDSSGSLRVSKKVFEQLRAIEIVPFRVYFSDPVDTAELYRLGEPNNFFTPNMQYRAVQNITGAVKVFQEFFTLIVVVLYVICVGCLVGFGVKAIKINIFEIGVLRALGTKTHNLALIFAAQMLLMGLVICVLSVLGMYAGVTFGDSVLVAGFVKFTKNPLAQHITVLRFRYTTAIVGAAAILTLSMVASVVPIVVLRKVKPRQIIVAKE